MLEELEEVNVIRISRRVTSGPNSKEFAYELEGFSDPSSSAYMAVIYLLIKSQNRTQVELIASKTCVNFAPLKKQTILLEQCRVISHMHC